MSRYGAPEYRPTRGSSRSPSRGGLDRRPSAAHNYGPRLNDLGRGGSEAPRGPRSQFGPRPPISSNFSSSNSLRAEGRELRDAPPLGSDRGRPPRDRGFDARDRIPSPRERSPPRQGRDTREYPPHRESDAFRGRRGSRDGMLPTGSSYQPEAPPPFGGPPPRDSFRGGRGRGESAFRGGRGRGRPIDDREPLRRSPPPRWGTDRVNDVRDIDRRDDRRVDRREEGGRPDWVDREHDYDRARRDAPPSRITPRASNDSLGSGATQQPAAPYVNPERQAMLESAGVDVSARRPSLAPPSTAHGPVRRDLAGSPYHLDGRAETAHNRYSRASSPPPPAPAVPAFTLSFAPQAPSASSLQSQRPSIPTISANAKNDGAPNVPPSSFGGARASAAPPARQQPLHTTQQQNLIHQVPAVPRAPRSVDSGEVSPLDRRVQPRRSWETPSSTSAKAVPSMGGDARNPSNDIAFPRQNASDVRPDRTSRPVSPHMQQHAKVSELGAPQGPKTQWHNPAQSIQNSRAPFTQGPYAGQPQSAGFARPKTPPPSAPNGPRNRAASVSPTVLHTAIPTAPKAIRPPPAPPRAGDRAPSLVARPPGGVGSAHQWAPPTAPRAAQQWNQWKRPGVSGPPAATDRPLPPKRDANADDAAQSSGVRGASHFDTKHAHAVSTAQSIAARIAPPSSNAQQADKMDVSNEATGRKTVTPTGYSARSSFFGQPLEKSEEETGTSDAADESLSTSEEEDDTEIEDPTLFEAKFESHKRELEKKLADLSARHLRSVTPLEAIARTVRVTWEDVERVRERDARMDIDEPQHIQPAATTSESDEMVDIVTPKGEDVAAVAIKEQPDATLPVRTLRRPSPDVITLHHLHKAGGAAFQDTKEYMRKLDRQERDTEDMLMLLDDEMADEQGEEDELALDFYEQTWSWHDVCENLDKVREAEEALERQQSAEPPPEPEIASLMPVNPALQSRIKYNSEYEFEMVLKQSEETARLEQERADRELLKIQADMEKEAVVPEQMTAKQMDATRFIDNNRLRDPDSLTMVFSYEAPPDDFLEHERTIFAAAFRETPKRWSDIADQLPGREPKDCIRHYYANKWDGRYKDKKGGRKKGGTRGRGGKSAPRGKGSAAMADMARVEEHVPGVSDSGRPKRAAAPTTFGEREIDAKAMLAKDSPVKRPNNGEATQEKPVKRRKPAGDKPGRKSKATAMQQPLAQLAAAPSMSPAQRYVNSIIPTKQEPVLDRQMDDARLLADMRTDPRLAPETQPVYMQQQTFSATGPIPVDAGDEFDRANVLSIASSRQSASSYWSVPEQNDFSKYIMHFGTDFAAIANHMGTKTQTMIKNHYQRSVDGGRGAELEAFANQANERRERGEDMGAPPTPTPINKRKYDNPPNPGQRTLPQGDAMDVDEPAIVQRPQPMKHASPQQFQPQPSFVTSAQATPVQAPRVAPSPVAIPATASTPLGPPAALSRPAVQQSMGSHMNICGDSRPESRSGFPPAGSFRHLQQAATSGQPPPLSRPIKDAHDSSFINSLKEEQEKAIRMQGPYHEQGQDRFDMFPHRAAMQQLNEPPMRRSPGNQPLRMQEERKPIVDDRPSQHARQFPPPENPLRRLPGSPIFGGDLPALGQHPASIRRLPLDSIPSVRGDLRHAQPNTIQAPRPSNTPAQEPAPPPKRSNVMSLLNSEPEEPKPPQQRAVADAAALGRPRSSIDSPIGHAHTMAPLAPPASTFSRPTFGQPAAPQSGFRMPFGQTSNMSSPQPVKQENPLNGNAAPRQNVPPKADWAARVLGQSTQSSPANAAPAPALEREVRPYYSHRSSLLGSIGDASRANPSPPPPRMLMGHSRTPSLTGQGPTQPPRERAGFLPSQQQQQQQQPQQQPAGNAIPSLQGSAFGQPAPPPFGHSLSRPPQEQLRHGHNPSIGGGFPTLQQQQQQHQRTQSRDDIIRSEQQLFNARQQQEHQELQWQQRMQDERRMREEQDRRLHEEREREQQQRRMQDERRMQQEQHERRSQDEQRRMQDEREAEHRRREQQFLAQHEHEQRQQQAQHQQMQPPFGRSLGQPGMLPQQQPPQQQQQQPFHPTSAAFEDRPTAAGMPSLREQSMREAQDRFHQEHEREQRMRREREAVAFGQREQGGEERRREAGEVLFGRRGTPLGGPGGFGQPQGPPPPGQGGGQGRR